MALWGSFSLAPNGGRAKLNVEVAIVFTPHLQYARSVHNTFYTLLVHNMHSWMFFNTQLNVTMFLILFAWKLYFCQAHQILFCFGFSCNTQLFVYFPFDFYCFISSSSPPPPCMEFGNAFALHNRWTHKKDKFSLLKRAWRALLFVHKQC